MAIPKEITEVELQKLIQLVRKTQFNYKLEQYETAALTEINKSVLRARREIGQKLKLVKPDATFTKDRLLALADELQDMTVAIQAQITGEITQVATAAGFEAYAIHNDILSFGGRVVNFNPVTLSAPQLNSLVNKTPIGGHILNEWVERTFDTNIKETFKSEIMTGMLKGESYKDLVKRFNTKAFDGLERDVEGLTRSYVQSVNVQAAQDVAQANKDIIKGWKWNSVLENRTCIRCMSLDSRNEIYPLGKGPDIPLHVRCRCFPEMVTKTFRELGIDVDEIQEAYRPFTIRGNINAETGKITTAKIGTGGGRIISSGRFLGDYNSFFKSQSKEIQVQMLGPTRYELWKKGRPLSSFASKDGRQKLIKQMH